ncbi:chalcone isomerase family protein [Pseudoteredinibacter isoporae]|uniref:chalcone isomerase family protein n=1 Tax=Pseudoteredinibacter isoporae TaxID=570281 RepID=UPI0031020B23
MITKILLLLLLSCPFLSNAEAALQAVGKTRFSVLWFDIYDATLFSEDGRHQSNQAPLKLSLDYRRDILAKHLLEETRKQWKTVPGINEQRRQFWLKELEKIWPDISEGDRLSFILHTDDRGEFLLFEQSLGIIESPGFARAFINIWIGPNSQYPRQAKKLIGES